jgi:PilZ domain
MSQPLTAPADDLAQPAPAAERRGAARLSTDKETCCKPALAPDGLSWPARVRDISAFGIGLLLDHRPQPYTRLTIDLERTTGGLVRTVLARVVHTTEQPGGDWLVGCALTAELSDDELRALQAERVRPAAPDCRAWVRFPCNLETVCYSAEAAPGEQLPARLLNLSPGGVGLVLPCQFEAHTVLNLQLPGPPGRPPRTVLVRVVQAQPYSVGEWFLGCEFADRLSDDELRALL